MLILSGSAGIAGAGQSCLSDGLPRLHPTLVLDAVYTMPCMTPAQKAIYVQVLCALAGGVGAETNTGWVQPHHARRLQHTDGALALDVCADPGDDNTPFVTNSVSPSSCFCSRQSVPAPVSVRACGVLRTEMPRRRPLLAGRHHPRRHRLVQRQQPGRLRAAELQRRGIRKQPRLRQGHPGPRGPDRLTHLHSE